MIHGPGCPVCVTPIEIIDKAVAIAGRPEVIFCSFGDMLRVPGSQKDLFTVKSEGGDVRVVYSPMDAVALAQKHPDRQVVFFAVGFETTAPANAMAVAQAAKLGLENFSVLVSHVLVPPAMRAVLDSPAEPRAGLSGRRTRLHHHRHGRVPADRRDVSRADRGHRLRAGRYLAGRADVRRSSWKRAGTRSRTSTPAAFGPRATARPCGKWPRCFRSCRGSGGASARFPPADWACAKPTPQFDAERRFDVEAITAEEPAECIAGEILQGHRKPHDCPAFGVYCTPERPLGAPMVSSEGACAAYYRYREAGTRG